MRRSRVLSEDRRAGTMKTKSTDHAPSNGARGAAAQRETRAAGSLELARFLPYQLAVAAESVSRCVAAVYAREFDLARDEWRVLAALGEVGEMKTKAAQLHTTLDKVQASRAVARLERKALLDRQADPDDRRNHVLRLTPAGRALYRRLLPRVQAVEAELLEALGASERTALDEALQRLQARASAIRERLADG